MPAVNLLARGYRLEVSADGATNWLKIGGLNDLNDSITPNKVDSSNYDSNGWAASEITMQAWSVVAKYNRQSTTGVTDPAAELLRACRGQFGDAARVYVRWYSTVQTSETGWQGRAIVEVQKSKTGVADLNEFTATLTGDGALASIANPYVPSSAPSILSATPSAQSVGKILSISGTGFSSVVLGTPANVTIGGVNATSFVVVSDQLISAVMPAGSAGSAPIIVTNPVGASAAFPYTRGA